MDTKDLIKKAEYVRKDLIETAVKNKAGHIAPSLSTVEILVSLYYKHLKIQDRDNRDYFVLSKAHGCYALYSILVDKGIIPKEHWENFYQDGVLSGCVERNDKFLLEASGGSLGHGLPIAVGIAYGNLLQKNGRHVYCLVGDGELQEGSMWEAIQFAHARGLYNLTVIVDNNKLQALDSVSNILYSRFKLDSKFKSFGFSIKYCDGHNFDELDKCFEKDIYSLCPKVIIADTIKGKGLKCMESVPKFHFRVPTIEELEEK